MSGALNVGRLVATLGLNSTPFMAGMNAATSKMQQFNVAAMATGRAMTRFVTLPMAIAGGAAIKTQKDFEASMTKIIGLVGVSREQVEKWNKEVLKMSQMTGKGPEELADALYFVTSAGIRGAEAMEVLEMSAKAAAAGLGETKVVADLVTSAMNAYGKENLSAAQATDILVASVREGKAEADELAGAMGMVLPIASEFGVTFDQVGAAFAGMTRTGTNARVAATQLKAILSAMASPSMQSADAMAEYGTNAETFRKTVREKGLITALLDLKDATEGHGSAMSEIFPNIRALMGTLDLLGANMQYNVQIFEALSDAGGSLERAFAEIEGTTQQKLNVALATFKTTLIGIGEVLKPFVTGILAKLNDRLTMISKRYQSMTEAQRKVQLRTLAITAAMGPFLIAISKAITIFTALRKAIVLSLGPYGALIAALGLVAAGIARHIHRQKEFTDVTGRSTKVIDELNSSVAEERMHINLLFARLMDAKKGTEEWNAAKEKVNSTYGTYLENLITETSTQEDLAAALDKVREARIREMKVKGVTAEMDRLMEENAVNYAKGMRKILEVIDSGSEELMRRGKLPAEFTMAFEEAMKESATIWEEGAPGWIDAVRGIGEKLYAEWVYGIAKGTKSQHAKVDFIQALFDQTQGRMDMDRMLNMYQGQIDSWSVVNDGITVEMKLARIDEDLKYAAESEKQEGRKATVLTVISLLKEKNELLDGEALKTNQALLATYEKELREIEKIASSLGAEAAKEAEISKLRKARKMLSEGELEANSKKIKQAEMELKTLQLETSGLNEIEKMRGRIGILQEEGAMLEGEALKANKEKVRLEQQSLRLKELEASSAGKLLMLENELAVLEEDQRYMNEADAAKQQKDIDKKKEDITLTEETIAGLSEIAKLEAKISRMEKDSAKYIGERLEAHKDDIEAERDRLLALQKEKGALSDIEQIELDIARAKMLQLKADDPRAAALLAAEIDELQRKKDMMSGDFTSGLDMNPEGSMKWFKAITESIKKVRQARADYMAKHGEDSKILANQETDLLDDRRDAWIGHFNTVMQIASQFTTGMSALFEAQKQRELSAAGDNAEKRAAIEEKYYKKQKKWAVAQAYINTALSIGNAALTKPFVPAGLIAMGIAAAAGAVQIAAVKAQNFAEGGMVYGETLARVGEYPGARSNPEVIAPLDKLKNILKPSSFAGMPKVITLKAEGRDLAATIDLERLIHNTY